MKKKKKKSWSLSLFIEYGQIAREMFLLEIDRAETNELSVIFGN